MPTLPCAWLRTLTIQCFLTYYKAPLVCNFSHRAWQLVYWLCCSVWPCRTEWLQIVSDESINRAVLKLLYMSHLYLLNNKLQEVKRYSSFTTAEGELGSKTAVTHRLSLIAFIKQQQQQCGFINLNRGWFSTWHVKKSLFTQWLHLQCLIYLHPQISKSACWTQI